MSNRPFVRGKDSTLKLFIAGEQVTLDVRSWRLARNVTEIADDVCGEDRSRLDTVTNYYTLTLEVLYSTAKQIRALLKDQENDDAGALPNERDVAGLLREKGGARFAWRLSGMTIDGWDIGASGRSEAVTINLPLRCQYAEEVPVV